MREAYQKAKENGWCRNCHSPTREMATSCLCVVCHPKALKAYKRLRDRRVSKGLCGCGGILDINGRITCSACLAENRAWHKNHRDKANKRHHNWIDAHPGKDCEYAKKLHGNLREAVLVRYGKRCNCCGETQPKFLQMDHINNDGNQHRKVYKGYIYRWIVEHNYPDTFQVLCANCNWGKHMNNGICPHKEAICQTL